MRDPQIDRVIELFAYYGTPSKIFKTLKEEYGDNALTYSAILGIRERNKGEILEVRKNVLINVPIMDIKQRWVYLQEIMEGSLAGDETPSKFGTYIKFDRSTALQAIKLANEMSEGRGAVNDDMDETIRQIVFQTFEDLKKEKPKTDDKELLQIILEGLGEKTRPYVNELITITESKTANP